MSQREVLLGSKGGFTHTADFQDPSSYREQAPEDSTRGRLVLTSVKLLSEQPTPY